MGAFLDGLMAGLHRIGRFYIASFVIFIAIFNFGVDTIVGLTEWAAEELGQLSGSEFVLFLTNDGGVLALANHFFPIAETWAMILASLPYIFIILTLRFVKQFVPTVAN